MDFIVINIIGVFQAVRELRSAGNSGNPVGTSSKTIEDEDRKQQVSHLKTKRKNEY